MLCAKHYLTNLKGKKMGTQKKEKINEISTKSSLGKSDEGGYIYKIFNPEYTITNELFSSMKCRCSCPNPGGPGTYCPRK